MWCAPTSAPRGLAFFFKMEQIENLNSIGLGKHCFTIQGQPYTRPFLSPPTPAHSQHEVKLAPKTYISKYTCAAYNYYFLFLRLHKDIFSKLMYSLKYPSCFIHRICKMHRFATVPDSSINSWESWFIFNLRKINTNQYYESVSLNVRNCKHITRTHDITWEWAYNNYCTYLNRHLLGAPREYVLHGLDPGSNWVPFWPLPLSMPLVAMPNQYLAVYFSGSGFTPNAFLLSGWLLTNVQVKNITTLLNICAHIYIHHIGITILLFFLHIFHSSWQTGWYRPFP